ncbi:MAG: 16S rRNA (guanine(966)-N(2))-methyltransferase RsmD [Sciscionella sp.]
MTRIVAGAAGGRRLAVPPRGTRPTSERVREALFSALDAAAALDGARVLDLYAGSGALGLEALSRGAAHALLVERDSAAVRSLRRNVAAVGLPGAEIRNGSVEAALRTAPEARYQVVLADPPYAVTGAELAAVLAALAGWTEPGSLVVVERAVRSADPNWPLPYLAWRSRGYGDTMLHWARHRDE